MSVLQVATQKWFWTLCCIYLYQLIILVFSRWILGAAALFPFLGEEKGKKGKTYKIPIYILVAKFQCETTWKCPRLSQDRRQCWHIPSTYAQQKTEYSLGISAETIKTRGKQETIHSPTNANKQNIRGLKDLKQVSKKCSCLCSVLSKKVQRTRQCTIYRAFISWKMESVWQDQQSFCKGFF